MDEILDRIDPKDETTLKRLCRNRFSGENAVMLFEKFS